MTGISQEVRQQSTEAISSTNAYEYVQKYGEISRPYASCFGKVSRMPAVDMILIYSMDPTGQLRLMWSDSEIARSRITLIIKHRQFPGDFVRP